MKINVTRSSMPPFEEYCKEIRELWDSRWLTNMGDKHREFQQRLQYFFQVPYVTLFTNGHLALESVLAAFDFPRGAEVITTPFTFASTTHAIVRCGLTPVFCDINDSNYTMDTEKLPALINDKTVAIVPVHVYGNLCNVDEIGEIALSNGLKVIYDAAHAFGVTRDGISAASFGDAAMFSFHATKVFHTIEGGAVCCHDAALVEKLDRVKNFGFSEGEVFGIGGNAKMNEFQAAMGLCNLRYFREEVDKRRIAAEHYRKRLGGIPGLKLCPEQAGEKNNYAYFPVVFCASPTRDEAYQLLNAQGISARKYFYPLTSDLQCYRDQPYVGKNMTPVASYVSERVLCLPLYSDLTIEDIDHICDIILEK